MKVYIKAGVSPSLAELAASKWEEVIEHCVEKVIYQYAGAFRRKRDELENSGDSANAAIFGFLFEVTSFGWDWNSKEQSFKPAWTLQDGTAAPVPADLANAQAEVLIELIPTILDPEMAAWIGEVLWARKRDYKGAERAVHGYLDSATRLEDPEQWVLSAQRIQRALNLARTLNNKSLIAKTVEYIESVLARYKGEDPSYLSAHLMELLLDADQGDDGMYAALAEHAGRKARATKQFDRARKYLELEKRWLTRGKRAAEVEAVKLAIAETHVEEAEPYEKASSPNYMLAEHHLERAIQAYRQIGHQEARIDELHKRLVETQKLAVTQLKTMPIGTMDVSRMTEETVTAVKGKSFLEALFWLAIRIAPVSVSQLRKQVERRGRGIADMVHEQVLDHSGKVIAQAPWKNEDDPESVERVAQFEMRRQTAIYRLCRAYGVIEPARRQLLMRHAVGVGDWIDILLNSPFVPEGREQIFARGLHAGLTGDLLVAAHLLTPQLENSFRHILSQNGVVTSKLDQWGNQEDLIIDELLDKEEFKTVFSENLEFDLRALLVRKDGPNLRHRFAHALINQGDFLSYDFLYLWGMVVHLCLLPLALQSAASAESP